MRTNIDTRGKGFYDIFPIQQGQTNVSFSYPGTIRAFHRHQKLHEYFFCAGGVLRLVLTDPLTIIYMERGDMVKIDPGRWHGFQVVGTEVGIMIEYQTEKYDAKSPDDEREAWDKFYKWEEERK